MEGEPSTVSRRIAVIGSGMAGLATAYLLNQSGEYNIKLFEMVRLRCPKANCPGFEHKTQADI